jgi:hypothetical protein
MLALLHRHELESTALRIEQVTFTSSKLKLSIFYDSRLLESIETNQCDRTIDSRVFAPCTVIGF